MTARVETLRLENGQSVLIEAHEVSGGPQRAGIGDKATKTFEAAWDSIQPFVVTLAKKIGDSDADEAEIKFGIKVSTDLNAIIAKTNGEANFEVTLLWKPKR